MINIIKAGLCVVALTSLMLVGVASAETSSDTTFSQLIKLIDCTATSVDDGQGQVHDIRCDGAIMTTVTSVEYLNHSLLARGTFDSSTASELRVFVAGRWYVLGVDSSLTADVNTWQLNVVGHSPIPAGEYNVVVEVATFEGLLLRDQTDNELTIVFTPGPSSPPSSSPLPGLIIPTPPNTGWQQIVSSQAVPSIFFALLVMFGLALVGVLTVVFRQRINKRGSNTQKWYTKR